MGWTGHSRWRAYGSVLLVSEKTDTPLSLCLSAATAPRPVRSQKWLDRIGEIERRETAMRLRYQIRSDANAIHTSSQPGSHHHSILYLHLYPKYPCRFRHPQSLYGCTTHHHILKPWNNQPNDPSLAACVERELLLQLVCSIVIYSSMHGPCHSRSIASSSVVFRAGFVSAGEGGVKILLPRP